MQVIKKTTIVFTIITLIIILFAGGCYGAIRGSGVIVSRAFDMDMFTRVETSSAFEVEIERGSTFSVSVTADDNFFDYIRVNEMEGTLKIDMLPGHSYFPNALKAKIVMPDIYSVSAYAASEVEITAFDLPHSFHSTASGASTIEFAGLKATDIALEAGTASRIQGIITGNDVDLEASGASRITLSGQAKNLKMSVSAASNVDLAGVIAENATVGLSGASSAIVNLSGRLDAGLTGASHLQYIGDPEIGNINLSDFSSVDKK